MALLSNPSSRSVPQNNRFERIWTLARVEFQKRYYDSYLGLVWALINPLMRVAIYYFAFTVLFQITSIPNYALHLFSGLVFWMFFVQTANKGIRIFQSKRYLIENLQFNKIDLFYASALSGLLGFIFSLFAYMVISLITGIPLYWFGLYLPILVLNIFLIALATSVLLATIHIYFKDITHLWDMMALLGFWITPIFFRGDTIMQTVPILMYANPLAGIITNVRKILLIGEHPDYFFLVYDLAFGFLFLFLSLTIFARYSHKAAEKL